jgi:hypothetical protein
MLHGANLADPYFLRVTLAVKRTESEIGRQQG